MRQQHADLLVDENLTLFVKVDSTPLGGNNWEVVEYQVVAGDRLVEAANLATSMVKLGVKCASQEASISECQELGVLTGAVSQLLKHHVLPLGALGTRRASVAHILHSIIFRLRLECFDWKDVARFVKQTFSLTADQGTEYKLGDVES